MNTEMFVFMAVIFCVPSGYLAWKFANRISSLQAVDLTDLLESVKKNTERQKAIILQEAVEAAREKIRSQDTELEQERQMVLRLQTDHELELQQSEQSQLEQEKSLLSVESSLGEKETQIVAMVGQANSFEEQAKEISVKFEQSLSEKLDMSKEHFAGQLKLELFDLEKLEHSRWILDQQDSLKSEAKKFAVQVLKNVYFRYSPRFVWPKSSFHITFQDKVLLAKHFNPDSDLLKFLIGETDVQLDAATGEDHSPVLRINGGAGVDKEVIRLTIEELIGRNNFSVDRAVQVKSRYQSQVEHQILRMGREAVRSLGLDGIHPEICSLIGALNFRTSHRQNQYFHSLEVARLAGMLAEELGVDPVLAKRAGLLHDIGKVLDYKIEGSHAVISGDFASRFGETEPVVDTILSHHDDKVVETPHAYLLKTADAMSGARPGARVDMEEGYQKRIEGINEVIQSFQKEGVSHCAVMSAGREVHVFVDHRQIDEQKSKHIGEAIAKKLENEVQFPGQIKVTVVRRLEVTEVA
jgi:ribonuclease Y